MKLVEYGIIDRVKFVMYISSYNFTFIIVKLFFKKTFFIPVNKKSKLSVNVYRKDRSVVYICRLRQLFTRPYPKINFISFLFQISHLRIYIYMYIMHAFWNLLCANDIYLDNFYLSAILNFHLLTYLYSFTWPIQLEFKLIKIYSTFYYQTTYIKWIIQKKKDIY